jgi:hypothetical protein
MSVARWQASHISGIRIVATCSYGFKYEISGVVNVALNCKIQSVLVANPEVLGSIPGATRFFEWPWVWNGVHSALVRVNEELPERKLAAPV